MDNCKSSKDVSGTTTIKKELEDTIGSSNYFDESEEVVNTKKYHCKEELDLKWDEKDNNYDTDYATFGNEDIDENKEKDLEYNKSISIGNTTKDIAKIENLDTGKGEIQGNLHIQKYIYKEELNLDWDERDNNTNDVSQSADEIQTQQGKPNKPTLILQNKEPQAKRRKKSIENPYTEKECSKCKKRLKNQNTLAKHLYYCGKDPHLQCDSCSYKTKYKNALITHIQRNHPQQIPKIQQKAAGKKGNKITKTRKEHELSDKCFRFCMTCNVSIDNPKINKCHKCESQLLYQCRKCNEFFPTHEKLTRHTINKCDPKGYYHCPACDFKSTIKSQVKFHQKVHLVPGSHVDVEDIKWKRAEGKSNTTDSQLFTCSSCNKQFQRQASLGSHLQYCVKSQGVNKPLTQYIKKKEPGHKYMVMKHCRKCNTNYTPEKGKLSKNECCGSTVSFKCLKCNRWYESRSSINYHLKNVCNLQTKHKCNKCDYEGSKSKLMNHIKNNHDLQTVECPKCKTLMKNKERLRQHLGYCHRELFKCEHCPYKNKRKYSLKLHIFQKHMN